MKPDAWLVEEFDNKGQLVWKMIAFFEPTELSWFKDLKSKTHNVIITPVYKNDKEAKRYDGIKKYDSSKFVTGL
jgi:hypothetical protein